MNDRFTLTTTPIAGLHVLRRRAIGDSRGWLERLFCSQELSAFTRSRRIEQINRSYTENIGTIRGLHFQKPPYAETKFVTCLSGRVFDVAVDMREGSSTLYSWHAVILDAKIPETFVIPEGFAHGFQTLTSACELLYFHTAPYVKEREGGLNPRDPRLGIAWPLTPTEVSDRDNSHPFLTEDSKGLLI